LKAEPIYLVNNIYVSWNAKMPKTVVTMKEKKIHAFMFALRSMKLTLCKKIPNIHQIFKKDCLKFVPTHE